MVRLALFVAVFAASVLTSPIPSLVLCAASWDRLEALIDCTRFYCYDLSHILGFRYKEDYEKGGLINLTKHVLMTGADFCASLQYLSSLKLVDLSNVALAISRVSLLGVRPLAAVAAISLAPILETLLFGFYCMVAIHGYLKADESDRSGGVIDEEYDAEHDFTKNFYDCTNAISEIGLILLVGSRAGNFSVAFTGIVASSLGALSVAREHFYGPLQIKNP